MVFIYLLEKDYTGVSERVVWARCLSAARSERSSDGARATWTEIPSRNYPKGRLARYRIAYLVILMP